MEMPPPLPKTQRGGVGSRQGKGELAERMSGEPEDSFLFLRL